MSGANWLLAVATAFLAATLTLCVTWLKAHRDEIRAQCDDLIKTINEAADLASAYWLTGPASTELALMEARLVGFQIKIGLLEGLACGRFKRFHHQLLKDELLNFYDACTGGQFNVLGRSIDSGRAREAQAVAAHLTVRIRRSFVESVALGSYIGRRVPWLQ